MLPSLLHKKQAEKANAIIAVGEDIKACRIAPKGSRFRIGIVNGKAVIKQVVLQQ